MSTVELHEIRHSFAGHSVLRGLSLGIDSGQYVVLLGPSGCGKTTTLRLIAGLQKPDQGTVLLDGKCVDGVAPRDRDVAMVFQHDGLYPHLTVEQSIRFALRGKLSAKEVRSRVDEAIELTKIQSILNRYPSRLSGGELRRAAVAKAVARRTSIRLLDEPLSALDAPLRHGLQDDILRWHMTVPGTTIHVTHDGQEAMRMADKIAVMEDGNIVQFATPSEVWMNPQSVSVARAIGTPPINLIATSLVQGKVECRGTAISISMFVSNNRSDADLVVGVRPDAFRITSPETSAENGADAIVVRGELLRSRPMQRDTHIYVRAGIHQIMAIVPSESLQTDSCRVGDEVRLIARRDEVHLFDAKSGQRIGPTRAN